MRPRLAHLACLLLLLSSLMVSDAHARDIAPARTPGGVFVRNMLLRAAVQDAEPALSTFATDAHKASTTATPSMPQFALGMPNAVTHTAHVHAVTGSSL